MKRDVRLRGLSSDHHQALVWARALGRHDASLEPSSRIRERFERELEPHFQVEEDLLLPALRGAGRADLAARVEADHATLREAAALAGQGDEDAARRLGAALADHVRFEERDVFPVCEVVVSGDVLDEVARRSRPPPGGRSVP